MPKADEGSVLAKPLRPAFIPYWPASRPTQQKTNAQVYVYQELRDRKVAMFIDHIQQGVWEMRYTLRAETPGTFHALPLLGDEVRVTDGTAVSGGRVTPHPAFGHLLPSAEGRRPHQRQQ